MTNEELAQQLAAMPQEQLDKTIGQMLSLTNTVLPYAVAESLSVEESRVKASIEFKNIDGVGYLLRVEVFLDGKDLDTSQAAVVTELLRNMGLDKAELNPSGMAS